MSCIAEILPVSNQTCTLKVLFCSESVRWLNNFLHEMYISFYFLVFLLYLSSNESTVVLVHYLWPWLNPAVPVVVNIKKQTSRYIVFPFSVQFCHLSFYVVFLSGYFIIEAYYVVNLRNIHYTSNWTWPAMIKCYQCLTKLSISRSVCISERLS